jgi:acetyl-CoA carboxylase carboxyl transferase subunit beta
MSWIEKIKTKTLLKNKGLKDAPIWVECKGCSSEIYIAELEKNLRVCPECDYHLRVSAKQRVNQILDDGSFIEHDSNLASTDPLKFKDTKKYKDRLSHSLKTGTTSEAIISGTGFIKSNQVEICFFEFGFMGGSMGVVVGEKITRSIERAITNKTPLVIFSCSGGARMQEGILSLMQMAKTAAALSKLAKERLPYISILTDPTMGGVSASFAMLGDIILAEPGALIGFAGPRVIKQTIQEVLPDGFQRSEFLFDHGLIDQITHRKELKNTLNQILCLLSNKPLDMLPKIH